MNHHVKPPIQCQINFFKKNPVMNEHQLSFGIATLSCPDVLWNDKGMLSENNPT